MWLRFESYYRHQNTRWATGIFTMIREVVADPDISPDVKARIQEFARWFADNVPAPKQDAIDKRAVFWFRAKIDLATPSRVTPWKRRPLTKLAARLPQPKIPSDRPVDASVAAEAIAKMHEFVKVIREGNLHIRVVETKRPGYIVYEDAFQVAAIPYRDAIEDHQQTLVD